MKTITYLSTLWMLFIASSACMAQEVTVEYDSTTKTIFVDVTNKTDGNMLILNHMTPRLFSKISFAIMNSEQKTVHSNKSCFILKDASDIKDVYIIPAKSTSTFILSLEGILDRDKEKVKSKKKIKLSVTVVCFLEKRPKESKRIFIKKTFDF